MSKKSVSLYYRDGGSDKVYHAQIEAKDDGYVVNFQFGRRGSTLQSGTKTVSPVSLDKATKIFDKLVQEKTAKGYSPGEDGTPFAGTDKAGEVSGLVPQLLNSIDEDRVKDLISDDSWFMQEKMDGFHQMVHITDDEVTVSNRKGLVVPGASTIVAALANPRILGKPLVLDGETIGDVFHPFDIIECEGNSLRNQGALDRYFVLGGLLQIMTSPFIKGVRTAFTTAEKKLLYMDIQAERGEGVVFKKNDALYVPGRPASGGNMVKFKFKASATCQVLAKNGDKRSVRLGACFTGNALHKEIGNVTIPVNYEIPEPGTRVEVEYLYAFPEGSLFQPIYKGPRPDKDKADLYNTLKFKQGTTDEEA